MYGPNGEYELDPDNDGCYLYDEYGEYVNDGLLPVFSTCKNNCPGGEWSDINSDTKRLVRAWVDISDDFITK